MSITRSATYKSLKVLELVHSWSEDRNGAREVVGFDLANIVFGVELEAVRDSIVEVAKLGIVATVELHGIVAVGRGVQAGRLGSVVGFWLERVGDGDGITVDDGRGSANRFSGHDCVRGGGERWRWKEREGVATCDRLPTSSSSWPKSDEKEMRNYSFRRVARQRQLEIWQSSKSLWVGEG